MKKATMCLTFVLLAFAAALSPKAEAQKHTKPKTGTEKAPDAVKQSFQHYFPDATDVKWQKLPGSNWLASFHPNSSEVDAEFTQQGEWVATRTNLLATQLPDTVIRSIQTQFPSVTVKDATRIERSDIPGYYRIDVNDAGADKTLLANDNGTITE